MRISRLASWSGKRILFPKLSILPGKSDLVNETSVSLRKRMNVMNREVFISLLDAISLLTLFCNIEVYNGTDYNVAQLSKGCPKSQY